MQDNHKKRILATLQSRLNTAVESVKTKTAEVNNEWNLLSDATRNKIRAEIKTLNEEIVEIKESLEGLAGAKTDQEV